MMAPEKAASDLESTSISIQVTNIRKISLISYSMREDYILGTLTYGVHHRGDQLVDLIESPSDKYTGKYRASGKGLINL